MHTYPWFGHKAILQVGLLIMILAALYGTSNTDLTAISLLSPASKVLR
jgi:hypothetical protein